VNALASYLRNVRKARGLSLKKVEVAAKVSNAYLSQLERGLRNPPHPDILKRLARVYEIPLEDLLEKAGYLSEDSEQSKEREKIEKVFQHAIHDPQFRYGTRLRSSNLSLDAKRLIVEMYEKIRGERLLQES